MRRIFALLGYRMCVSLGRMQASPSTKVGKTKAQRVVEDDSSSDDSCDVEPLSLAKDVKRELARGNAAWHSMCLYHPPFTCGQWCIYYEGCIHCLVGLECRARRFMDRDEVKWVLQRWEEVVQVEAILHPTPSVNMGGSGASVASCAQISSTPLHPVPPSSIPPRNF